jgi:hypothetical protein
MPVSPNTLEALRGAARLVKSVASHELDARVEHCDCCDRDRAVNWTEHQAQKSLISASDKILKIVAELDRKREGHPPP